METKYSKISIIRNGLLGGVITLIVAMAACNDDEPAPAATPTNTTSSVTLAPRFTAGGCQADNCSLDMQDFAGETTQHPLTVRRNSNALDPTTLFVGYAGDGITSATCTPSDNTVQVVKNPQGPIFSLTAVGNTGSTTVTCQATNAKGTANYYVTFGDNA